MHQTPKKRSERQLSNQQGRKRALLPDLEQHANQQGEHRHGRVDPADAGAAWGLIAEDLEKRCMQLSFIQTSLIEECYNLGCLE